MGMAKSPHPHSEPESTQKSVFARAFRSNSCLSARSRIVLKGGFVRIQKNSSVSSCGKPIAFATDAARVVVPDPDAPNMWMCRIILVAQPLLDGAIAAYHTTAWGKLSPGRCVQSRRVGWGGCQAMFFPSPGRVRAEHAPYKPRIVILSRVLHSVAKQDEAPLPIGRSKHLTYRPGS